MPNYTMPADHKPTPSEFEVRKVLQDELSLCPEISTSAINAIAFRIMVVLGEVIPASSYLHYLKKEKTC
jgi:hypothetical protein